MLSPETPTSTRLRILAFAYACDPERGSEPGVGWIWTRLLATLGEVCVVTRGTNRSSIEREVRRLGGLPNVRFVYVDLPKNAERFNRSPRVDRLSYAAWQAMAWRRCRPLVEKGDIDLAWHVTFANCWIGSTAALLRTPFVYGPVGGGVTPPFRLLHTLGARGIAFEAARFGVQFCGRYLNPIARLSWRRANLILAQNEETKQWFPRRYRGKVHVFPNAIVEATGTPTASGQAGAVAMYAGRLAPWKGVDLAVRALQHLDGWRLIVCGSGPSESALQSLVSKLDLVGRVEFRGWVERADLLATMTREASVFVFPSLHDDGGWAVVEAMLSGLSVVCLNVGGPPSLAGRQAAVDAASRDRTVRAIASAVKASGPHTQRQMLIRAERFTLASRAAELTDLLASRGLIRSFRASP